MASTAVPHMTIDQSADTVYAGGRIAPGAPADLVLFDPDTPFVLDRFKLRSKSKNTPFDGQRMQGKVIGTWVSGVSVLGDDA